MATEKLDSMENDLAKTISDAVWERIRSLTLSTAKYENFVRLGSATMPENGELHKTIWEGINPDEDPKSMAMDFVLMSLGCALAPENSRILLKIGESESISPNDLAKQLGMTELTVRERINALFQAGFVGRNYERGTNFLTDAGQSLVKVLNQIVEQLVSTIMEKLPDLINTSDETGV
tara:strand:+ start:439 stop:972 length:534 start_codon:yes stop_codon:yes gene_type:complete